MVAALGAGVGGSRRSLLGNGRGWRAGTARGDSPAAGRAQRAEGPSRALPLGSPGGPAARARARARASGREAFEVAACPRSREHKIPKILILILIERSFMQARSSSSHVHAAGSEAAAWPRCCAGCAQQVAVSRLGSLCSHLPEQPAGSRARSAGRAQVRATRSWSAAAACSAQACRPVTRIGTAMPEATIAASRCRPSPSRPVAIRCSGSLRAGSQRPPRCRPRSAGSPAARPGAGAQWSPARPPPGRASRVAQSRPPRSADDLARAGQSKIIEGL